jgi:hypothetical protein
VFSGCFRPVPGRDWSAWAGGLVVGPCPRNWRCVRAFPDISGGGIGRVFPGVSWAFPGRDWSPCPGRPDTLTNPRGGGERRPEPHGCRVRTEWNYGFVMLSRRRRCRFGTTTPLGGLQLPSRKSRFLGSGTEPRSKKRETQPVSAGEASETTPERRKRGYNSRVLQLRAGRRTPRYRLVTLADRGP